MHPLWQTQHIMKETVHTIKSHAWRRKWSIGHAYTNQPWTTNTKDAVSLFIALILHLNAYNNNSKNLLYYIAKDYNDLLWTHIWEEDY